MNKKLLVSMAVITSLAIIIYVVIAKQTRRESTTSSLRLTDERTRDLLLERITPFLDEYGLHGTPINLVVSSKHGTQTVNFELQTSSLDIANNATFFFWTLPRFPLFDEINNDGANIVMYQAKIIDENGTKLLDFTYDLQSGSGSWTQDEKLIQLGNPPPSSP